MPSAIDFYRPTQEGAIGRAIFDYRRALRLDPKARPEPYADAVVAKFPRTDRVEVLNLLGAARRIMEM